MEEKITVYDGKYTLIFNQGKFRCLRYGEEWRDLTGDGMILAMFQRIQELEEKLNSIEPLANEGIENVNSFYSVQSGNGKMLSQDLSTYVMPINTIQSNLIKISSISKEDN